MRTMIIRATATVASGVLLALGAPAAAHAASPLDDAFYHYTGKTPLKRLKPGTVLKTRTVDYSVQGAGLPLKTTQILYRTTNQVGKAVANVTTLVRPLVPSGAAKVVSYESFYDSLNPADEPSAVIAGGSGVSAGTVNVETALFAPLLAAGYSINIPDTEGQTADFAAGPEYGVNTLDSLRAISHTSATGVGTSSKIGLIGYSGGAIAAEWAAEQAPTYAPEIAKRIIGTAIGGVLVQPSRNLHYVEGSQVWAGVMPMALVGVARSFHLDLKPYLSAYGQQVYAAMQKAPIADVLGRYPGLTWKQLATPRYAVPESVPVYVKAANKLIMGTAGTPSSPMFIGQGTGGQIEGTQPGGAGIGAGDGVMVAGDVRSLARQYCGKGVAVQYREYPTSHFTSVPAWLPEAAAWLLARFAGTTAPQNCSSIAPGNPITPIKVVE